MPPLTKDYKLRWTSSNPTQRTYRLLRKHRVYSGPQKPWKPRKPRKETSWPQKPRILHFFLLGPQKPRKLPFRLKLLWTNLKHFQPFQMCKFQNFLQPWWIYPPNVSVFHCLQLMWNKFKAFPDICLNSNYANGISRKITDFIHFVLLWPTK